MLEFIEGQIFRLALDGDIAARAEAARNGEITGI
jgi:hypothetical protein